MIACSYFPSYSYCSFIFFLLHVSSLGRPFPPNPMRSPAPFSLHLLSSVFLSFPSPKEPLLSHCSNQITWTLLLPFLLLPKPPILAGVLFYFPGLCSYSRLCEITSEDLKLGASGEIERKTFAFLPSPLFHRDTVLAKSLRANFGLFLYPGKALNSQLSPA